MITSFFLSALVIYMIIGKWVFIICGVAFVYIVAKIIYLQMKG